MLNLTTFYFAMPALQGITRFNERRGRFGFWTMCLSMLGVGLAFTVAGVLQTYLERVLGLGYMPAQAQMRPWFGVVIGFGIVFLVGLLVTVRDLLRLEPVTKARQGA